MTNEDGGFDAGEFYDKGVDDAGIDTENIATDTQSGGEANVITPEKDESDAKAETPETDSGAEVSKKDDKPSAEDVAAAIESTKETEQEADSIISSLIPKPEAAQTKQEFEPGKYVPVEDHIKLRQRAQAAEREAEDLRRSIETSTTRTGGVKPGTEVEKSPFEKFVDDNPDEELVPLKVQLEERKFQEAKAQKAQQAKESIEQAEREKQEKQYRSTEAAKAISARAEQSEAEVRKSTPDYDAVVKPFVDANMLTNDEKIAFLKDANPAQKLYDICKAKADALRGVIGTTTTTPAKTTKPKEVPKPGEEGGNEDMTDDELFDELKDEVFQAGDIK